MSDNRPADQLPRESAEARTKSRLAHLEKFRVLLPSTECLKDVFDAAWLEAVREAIDAAHGRPSLQMKTYTAFIGYMQDAILNPEGPNLIEELDRAFSAIRGAVGKALANKLRLAAGDHLSYASTVFEVLLVGRFAAAGRLLEYEPVIASGRPEAKVQLGEAVIIEARITADDSFRRPHPFFLPEEGAQRLVSKVEEKYAQLAAAGAPTLLFLALNVNLHFDDMEVTLALDMIGADHASRMVSGIVLVDDFRARRFRLWRNPQATLPLSAVSEEALAGIVDLQ